MTPASWLRSLTILQRVTFALMVAAALTFAVRLNDKPLEEIVQIVTGRVRAWAHDPENADDTTILLARRI